MPEKIVDPDKHREGRTWVPVVTVMLVLAAVVYSLATLGWSAFGGARRAEKPPQGSSVDEPARRGQ